MKINCTNTECGHWRDYECQVSFTEEKLMPSNSVITKEESKRKCSMFAPYSSDLERLGLGFQRLGMWRNHFRGYNE